MVKVLVWNSRTDKEGGFWAEFEGEQVSSYEEGEKVYTLYKCTAYDFEAYRVHVYDQRTQETLGTNSTRTTTQTHISRGITQHPIAGLA